MAQVTIYIPDDLESELRREAKRAGRSLSSLVVDLARRQLRPTGWPPGFADMFGAWRGEFEEPADPPPDEVDFVVREPAAKRRRRRK